MWQKIKFGLENVGKNIQHQISCQRYSRATIANLVIQTKHGKTNVLFERFSTSYLLVKYFCSAFHTACFLLCTFLLIYVAKSVDQSPSWEANSVWTAQELLLILWNPKVPKSPTLLLIPNQLHSIHNSGFYSWRYSIILFSHIHLRLRSGFFLSVVHPRSFKHFSFHLYVLSLHVRLNYPPWYDHRISIWWRVHIIEFLNIQFSSPSVAFSLFGPRVLSILLSNIVNP
jgi:hypothetical protein